MEFTVESLDQASGSATMELGDEVFNVPFNEGLVHQVTTAYMAGARAGTKAQKTRSDVRGGGAKPWRQKGMGRARAGTSRSPLWRKGGVTFAARPRDYSQKVNRKMYRHAMAAILSQLIRDQRLVVIDTMVLAEPKTRVMVAVLKRFVAKDLLIISDAVDDNLYLASRNLRAVAITDVAAMDPVSLVRYDKILFTRAAMEKIEAWLK